MANEGLKALQAQLGGAAPKGLSRLSAKQLRDLAEAVESAKRRQAVELAGAADQALDHIPRLLRGPVRKVFG